MAIAYVKGVFVEAESASISIAERGFRYGDGLFESIRIVDGKLRHSERHLKRLQSGMHSLLIPSPQENLEEVATQLLAKNGLQEGILRLSVSRGIGSNGYLPIGNHPPTVVGEVLPLPQLSDDPLKLWLANWRKPSRKMLPVEAKLLQGMNSTLARLEAHQNECDEALMLNAQDAICEASSANIFWRSGGLIYTPSDKCGLLKGIAREILLERWQVHREVFALENLKNADSVMLCNSIRGAMPVYELKPQGWQWVDSSLADEANEILYAA